MREQNLNTYLCTSIYTLPFSRMEMEVANEATTWLVELHIHRGSHRDGTSMYLSKMDMNVPRGECDHNLSGVRIHLGLLSWALQESGKAPRQEVLNLDKSDIWKAVIDKFCRDEELEGGQ